MTGVTVAETVVTTETIGEIDRVIEVTPVSVPAISAVAIEIALPSVECAALREALHQLMSQLFSQQALAPPLQR
jgi:hypothetical protein